MNLQPISSPRLVIIDQYDAPQTQMVAVLGREVEPGTFEWRYVAERSASFPSRGGINCKRNAANGPLERMRKRDEED